MIFQEPQSSLNPVLSVGEQIGEVLEWHFSMTGKALHARIIDLLTLVGIPDPEQRVKAYPHQLSGGMKQRVMIAIALAGDPELLIADEPTTALDVTIQAQILTLLKSIQRKTGMAILLISHDLAVVAQMADHVAVMYAGQIVETAPRDAFFKQAEHPYSQKLFEALPTEQNVRCHLYDPQYQSMASTNTKPVNMASLQTVSSNQAPILELEQLQVHFPIKKGLLQRVVGHVKAVDGVSLQLKEAETVALVGESGCGKTTVGKGILQLVSVTGGEVTYQGKVLNRLSSSQLKSQRSALQIIFQDPYASMNPRMTVGQVIEEAMLAGTSRKTAEERAQRVAQLLERVGLNANYVHRYPHEFSGGQRQRICIARALAADPKVLICDEPTSALDVSVQAQILNLLRELQQEFGLSYFFITHNISVVEYLAHRIAVMYLGRIVEQGTREQILKSPMHPYTQALLAAVPTLDDDKERTVIQLSGELPSP
ncbi:UNVERIFIED_CONTAM: hypothetical protein GTU68_042517, partial [Idotea baltica]|nr:hypothetical protein [Idotea baltica]